jgi:hypothetical protein
LAILVFYISTTHFAIYWVMLPYNISIFVIFSATLNFKCTHRWLSSSVRIESGSVNNLARGYRFLMDQDQGSKVCPKICKLSCLSPSPSTTAV